EALKKTAAPTGMASDAALLVHLEQDDVGIAVETHLTHLLAVPRLFAFAPQPAARAGPVHGVARFHSFAQRLGIHPGNHQYGAISGVLCNGGNQTLPIELHLRQPGGSSHGSSLTLTPCAARNSLASRTVYSP